MKDVFPCTSLWAVRLQARQGAPGDSAELAAGSSHPRGEEAGLLAALGWGLLLGAMNTFGLLCTPAAQSKFSKTHRYLQSKTLWLACSSYTLGKVKDWEECSGGICTRAPVGWEDRPPRETRFGAAWSSGRGSLMYTPLFSRLGIWSTPPGPKPWGRVLKWESVNFLWCYLYPRFKRTFI